MNETLYNRVEILFNIAKGYVPRDAISIEEAYRIAITGDKARTIVEEINDLLDELNPNKVKRESKRSTLDGY